MIFRQFLYLGIGLISIMACQKKETSPAPGPSSNRQWTIRSGLICGWCAANDSLKVGPLQSSLLVRRDCDRPIIDRVTNTQAKQYQVLLAKLDTQAFKAISLNTCYLCADGCDFWVSIENANSFHSIRFGINDSARLASILPLLQELEKIQLEMGYPPLF